jgi:hypothetical protein
MRSHLAFWDFAGSHVRGVQRCVQWTTCTSVLSADSAELGKRPPHAVSCRTIVMSRTASHGDHG